MGKPPFETATLKETYYRITENAYTFPQSLSHSAKSLIRQCLNPEPSDRPKLDEILAHEFFTCGYLPRVLSPACCSSVPKFPVYTKFNRYFTKKCFIILMLTVNVHVVCMVVGTRPIAHWRGLLPNLRFIRQTSLHASMKSKRYSVVILDDTTEYWLQRASFW